MALVMMKKSLFGLRQWRGSEIGAVCLLESRYLFALPLIVEDQSLSCLLPIFIKL
jgi:hypothetical protein